MGQPAGRRPPRSLCRRRMTWPCLMSWGLGLLLVDVRWQAFPERRPDVAGGEVFINKVPTDSQDMQ